MTISQKDLSALCDVAYEIAFAQAEIATGEAMSYDARNCMMYEPRHFAYIDDHKKGKKEHFKHYINQCEKINIPPKDACYLLRMAFNESLLVEEDEMNYDSYEIAEEVFQASFKKHFSTTELSKNPGFFKSEVAQICQFKPISEEQYLMQADEAAYYLELFEDLELPDANTLSPR